MDAGARGRRLLQRREYRAKVSEFIPKELEDQFNYNKNGELVFELDIKKTAEKVVNKIKLGAKKIFSGPIMKPNITKDQHLQKIRNSGGDPSHWANSFEPEGEMIEANSAQMKAMHDAQMKKKEDDKVAAKKKSVKEGSAYGITRGSGKPSGAFKDYLDKKKKEKTKKEEVQLEAKVDKGMIFGKSAARNERRFGKKGHFDPRGAGSRGQGTSERAKLAVKRGEEHKARRGVKTKGVKEEVQLEAKKSCGEGEYYCHDMKKCKPIPDGMKVGKDGMLVKEDMKGMSQKSGDKRSTESGAGMTAQGVAKYNRRTGGNLKTAVTTPPSKLKPGSKAAKRRKSFCARSKSWTGPRGKAARRRWNCSYEPELPMIIDEKKKLFNSAPLSDRVAAWSKKITEGDSYVKSDRNKFGLPKDLKSVEKKSSTKKVTSVNYGAMAQSYEPQGEMIEMAGKYKGKINTDVLKNNPNLDPNKPGDYIKLKRLSAKVNKINEVVKKLNPNAIFPTVSNVKIKNEIISDTGISTRNQKKKFGEAKMTPTQKERKEKYVKGMKKDKGGFTKRYGKDGKSVMYATATKMAMKKEEIVNEMDDMGSKVGIGLATTVVGGGLELMRRAKNAAERLRKKRQDSLKVEDFYRKKYTVKDGYKKTDKMTKSNKRSGDSKAQYRELHKDLAKYKIKKLKTEGSLHSWFKGSKSKDGKPGWVNVVTGGTCASDKPGEGTPKCVSSSKRASMSKAERLSASRRKKKADPGQQSKSGAAKPTYVATDKKKKKVDEMNQGPSTPVGNYDGKIMPKFGAGRIGNVRLKGGKTLADLVKGV